MHSPTAAKVATPLVLIPGQDHGGISVLIPGKERPYGVLEWPAMLRLLAAEQKNTDYPPYWN